MLHLVGPTRGGKQKSYPSTWVFSSEPTWGWPQLVSNQFSLYGCVFTPQTFSEVYSKADAVLRTQIHKRSTASALRELTLEQKSPND